MFELFVIRQYCVQFWPRCLSLQLSHGILLGVVGSDIPLLEVMKLAPRYMVSSGLFKSFLQRFLFLLEDAARFHNKSFECQHFVSFLHSWELTATPSSSPTTVTSWLTPTFDLWWVLRSSSDSLDLPGGINESSCTVFQCWRTVRQCPLSYSIKTERNWSRSQTTTVWICPRWSGRMQRRRWSHKHTPAS